MGIIAGEVLVQVHGSGEARKRDEDGEGERR
jgi:hypothetical protein